MSGMSLVPSHMLASNLESNLGFSQFKFLPKPQEKDKEEDQSDSSSCNEDVDMRQSVAQEKPYGAQNTEEPLENRLNQIKNGLTMNYEHLNHVKNQ